MPTRPEPAPWLERAGAALGGLSLLAGVVSFGVAVVGSQGLWYAGYASEAGVAGQASAAWYRLGLLGVALGLLLVAPGLRRQRPGWLGLAAAGLLVCSGVLATVSASVTCSPGCPLPPHESPTPADLGHAAASILSVGACVLAMAVLAVGGAETTVRTWSRWMLAWVAPLVVLVAFGLVGPGRGHLTGLGERALLVAVTGWTIGAAWVTATARRGSLKC